MDLDDVDDGPDWLRYDQDEYDWAAIRAGVPYDLDDRPAWERSESDRKRPEADHELPEVARCVRCWRAVPLDPYGECLECRVGGGWCRWCAMETIEYRTLGLGRTCYRWWLRNKNRCTPAELSGRLARVLERRWARAGLTKP